MHMGVREGVARLSGTKLPWQNRSNHGGRERVRNHSVAEVTVGHPPPRISRRKDFVSSLVENVEDFS